jgi:hypothetical protein
VKTFHHSILLLALLITLCGCQSTRKTASATKPDPTATLRDPIKIETGKVREPLPYRIVSFHKGRADKRLIRLAHELGFNGVQIQIEGSTVKGIKEFAKYDAKEHLVDYCHSLGMKVTLWVHELSDVPYPWMPEWLGPVTTDNPAIWSLLDARYEWMLSQAVPNVDGLVLTVVETYIRATDTNVMVKLAQLLREKCDKHHKSLIVRTFVWYPEEFKNVMAAVDKLPQDQVIMSKCVPQDWNLRGMDALEIGDVGGRPQIEEFDVAGEYFLKSTVPNCMPDLLKRQFDYGVSKGIQGICVRVDRDDASVLHEPNEVNLWALGMLASGAADNVDDIWQAWATNRFGKAAAPGVIRTLRPAGDVVAEMLSIGSFSFGDTRRFPPLGDEDFLGQLHQNWWWDDKYSDEHFKAEAGDEAYTNQIAIAKNRASSLAQSCLMDLDLVKDKLKSEDYEILRTRLLTTKAQMDLRGPMAVAVLDYRRLANATTDDARDSADAALQGDLARLWTAAYPPWKAPEEITHLGRTWQVGEPEEVWRDAIYSWIWKMDQLRRGEDPRPVMSGRGILKQGRKPSTQPTTAPRVY